MSIERLTTIKNIDRVYSTGEEPILVVCSDFNAYICKYLRSSVSAYKHTCELVGAQLAQIWKLNTPSIALVNIKSEHFSINRSGCLSAPAFASRRLNSVIDITSTTAFEIPQTDEILFQLLEIALFDLWVANEDRNWNNANLLYDIEKKHLVAIDHGCVFNTATYEYPLSQLTLTDSILLSDLAKHLLSGIDDETLKCLCLKLEGSFAENVNQCASMKQEILQSIPEEWNVPGRLVGDKIDELFKPEWMSACWSNFVEYLAESNGE